MLNEIWAALFVGSLSIGLLVAVASWLSPDQRAVWKSKRALKRALFQKKPLFARVLLRFGSCWLVLVLIVNLAAVAGAIVSAGGFLDGVIAAADMYSPFTISTYIINVVLITPALAAHAWADRIESRAASTTASAA
ncbi:hypothetical protein [Candidatus Binatus sp.]|uniref:hypothetical protein n=1 Tax=Candidatus Binatus sp. TaxID=2811406 RepID=UPI00272D1B84|nr:hypothetical protein [Candidatus Binatus sp.]